MTSESVERTTSVREELINNAFSDAMKAHKSPEKPFRENKSSSKDEVIFSFPGSWSVQDWYCEGETPFGETRIDSALFPSLRSVGNNEYAVVNKAFQERFKVVRPQLQDRVEEAVRHKKKIVFTGHSSGGPIAVLATIWFLEDYAKQKTQMEILFPICLTFGSPLIGNHIFSHALRREKWSHYFIHLITRFDIIPRTSLAPLSSNKSQFQQILEFFKRQIESAPLSSNKSCFWQILQFFKRQIKSRKQGSHEAPSFAHEFFINVMSNALTLASHVANNSMESSNVFFDTVASFIELSPYRPFGTYIFSNGCGNLVTLENADAVLQLLFYSCQPSSDDDGIEITKRSFTEHCAYESELLKSLKGQISSDSGIGSADECNDKINKAADDMEMGTRSRLCLLAAGEAESQKRKNKDKMDSKKKTIETTLDAIESYKKKCEAHKVGYYDSFKLQRNEEDFKVNVKRLELAGIFDEMLEMLKSYKLPDQFEGLEEWIKIGTRYRHLVEPLDIANYYRHSKDEDTGSYMEKGRPKRYKYPQRWLEHAQKMQVGSCGESCFWAEVEELCRPRSRAEADSGERTLKVLQWGKEKVNQNDVFSSDPTFVRWLKSLSSDKVAEIEQLFDPKKKDVASSK